MSKSEFENLKVYKLSEELADEIWNMVSKWNNFAKDTIGKQIVRSADSIGANIAEGSGRFSFEYNKRFIKIARGSLREAQHFLRRAYKRDLIKKEQITIIKQIIDALAPMLSAYLNSIGKISSKTKDDSGESI